MAGENVQGDNVQEEKKWYSPCHLVIFRVLSYIFTILMLLANLGSFGFNAYIVLFCPYYHCGYFYTGEVHNMSNESHHNHLINVSAAEMKKYSNWNKVVISTATIAGVSSYFMIIFLVMLPLYNGLRSCCRQPQEGRTDKRSCKSVSILSPFFDDGSGSSTKLEPKQACYFYFFYFSNLFLYASNLIVFAFIMKQRVSHTKRTPCDIDETGLILQLLSQLCAVQSCFIFSKVAYSSVNNFFDILKKFKKIDVEEDELIRLVRNDPSIDIYLSKPDYSMKTQDGREVIEEEDTLIQDLLTEQHRASPDQARLYLLQNIYQWSVCSIQASLKPYGLWFSFHWILYTLSAFLSLAFLTDTIDLYLYNTDEWYLNNRNIWSLTYISLFTIQHAFLFLYPCFRAAKITSVQGMLASRFAARQWRHIKPPIQAQFLSYLQSQNFGFQISLFCADMTFGFNLAFVSIFIGTFGIVLKLSL